MSTESPLAGDQQPKNDAEIVAGSAATITEDDGVLYDEDVSPQHGVLGFTLRELLIACVWLIMFVVSFFPLYGQLSSSSIWTQGIEWIQPIGLPTVAVFLIVLRRFSPDGIRRVGSLGVDQFASVAFAFSALYWAARNVELVTASVGGGIALVTWVTIVELVAALALVALTVFAPLIPGLREDFHGRLVTLAHRTANPVRPVVARPRPEKPAALPDAAADDELASDEASSAEFGDRVPLTSHVSGGDLGTEPGLASELGLGADEGDYVPAYARSSRGAFDEGEVQDAAPTSDAAQNSDHDRTEVIEEFDLGEDVDQTAPRDLTAASAPTSAEATGAQPFWALAPVERDVVDETGALMFRIGPTAWALVIEDRGGAYVVRHDDGRVGYLHDISDITRG